MQSFNSCEDITTSNNNNNKNGNKYQQSGSNSQINEHVIQCIAELSYYSLEVLQQVFLVSKNPKIQAYLRNYVIQSTNVLLRHDSIDQQQQQQQFNLSASSTLLASVESIMSNNSSSNLEISNNNNKKETASAQSTSAQIHNDQTQSTINNKNSATNNDTLDAVATATTTTTASSPTSTTTKNKLMEYIRQAFATSREIELGWFTEGFRTTHMNLLCNVVFECPLACRAVLDCEGLVMLILFHGKHLDPENPGLNEWSAFAMRTVTKEVPEAGERIAEMRNKAQQMSDEKRKQQEESEAQMRAHMRNHQQEFM